MKYRLISGKFHTKTIGDDGAVHRERHLPGAVIELTDEQFKRFNQVFEVVEDVEFEPKPSTPRRRQATRRLKKAVNGSHKANAKEEEPEIVETERLSAITETDGSRTIVGPRGAIVMTGLSEAAAEEFLRADDGSGHGG